MSRLHLHTERHPVLHQRPTLRSNLPRSNQIAFLREVKHFGFVRTKGGIRTRSTMTEPMSRTLPWRVADSNGRIADEGFVDDRRCETDAELPSPR
jgi:hypothetical protein